MKSKILLILTTAGRLHWLKNAIASLRDPLDVLVVDDATPKEIGIGNFCKEHGFHFITKSKPKGLTDTWNIGYRFFKEKEYTYCILSNDDGRFPDGFSRGLIRALNTRCHLVGPVTNASGNALHQWVRRFVRSPKWSYPEDFKNFDRVQETLVKQYKDMPLQPCDFVNGFCFAFSIAIFRFAFSPTCLFDPKNTNVDAELDLARRVRSKGGNIVVCRTSYVYHQKMGTYRELGWKKIFGHRNRLWR